LPTFTTLIHKLQQGLHDRFQDIYVNLGITRPQQLPRIDNARKLQFDSTILLMAPAVDPAFGYWWLQDHPGTVAEKDELKHRING